jgi:tRNA-dihydrouridine synthase
MDSLRKLEQIFSSFPGIGPRQAKRFVHFILSRPNSFSQELVSLLSELKKLAELKQIAKLAPNPNRESIPVSVKTRIGINEIVVEDWVKQLLETEPANISIHGRTLKQMYSGLADWEAIGRAAVIIKQTQTTVMGNGDTTSRQDALDKIKKYNLDGVLIGRAAMGNPYLWQGKTNEEISPEIKLHLALEHARLHAQSKPENLFIQMRKHFSFYISSFPNSHDIKIALLRTNTLQEAQEIIENALEEKPWEKN